MRFFWLMAMLWLMVVPVRAQAPAVLRGQVLDAETRQPVPNAQVGVAGNRLGTSTNDDGRFVLSIPPEYQQATLEVALLGYRKYAQPLPPLPGPELRIALQISPAALGEVRVTASVEGIVREAVARIPRNYPARPTRLTGFYRESDNDAAGRPRYLVEGLLVVGKAPYRERTDEGDVQIQQSRKVDLRAGQPMKFEWAGGPFIAHWADFVHRRAQFISPAHFRDYAYRLGPGSSYQDRPVYVVEFAPRPGRSGARYAGRMYIDQDSYAFLGAAWHYTAAGLRHALNRADARELRVAYQPYAGRWHLKSVWWQTRAHLPLGPPLHYFGEFLTTAIDTAQAPRLTYVERVQNHDVFLENATPYDSAFWQGRTTLLPPEALRRALLDQTRQQRADSLFRRPVGGGAPGGRADSVKTTAALPAPALPGKLFSLLGRLRYGGAVGVWPLAVAAAGVAVDVAPAGSGFRAEATTDVAADDRAGWWSGTYEFDLTPALAMHLTTRHLFRQFSGDGWELGLRYQRNLTPRHRPLRARAGLAYSRQTVARELGTFVNASGGVEVDGHALTADKLAVRLQTVAGAALPTLGLGLELSHKLELVADAGYLLPLSHRTELEVSETSGFYFARRTAAFELPHADVHLRANEQPTATLPWQPGRWLFSFGLLYRLR